MTKKQNEKYAKRMVVRHLKGLGASVGKTTKAKRLSSQLLRFEYKFTAEQGGITGMALVYAFAAELERRRLQSFDDGSVYIIGNRTWGLCKIGMSKTPGKRLAGLQTGCPFELAILALFENRGRDLEALLHERARPYHERGEWFRIEGRLKDFLDNENDVA